MGWLTQEQLCVLRSLNCCVSLCQHGVLYTRIMPLSCYKSIVVVPWYEVSITMRIPFRVHITQVSPPEWRSAVRQTIREREGASRPLARWSRRCA
jgi:hypothetical protein